MNKIVSKMKKGKKDSIILDKWGKVHIVINPPSDFDLNEHYEFEIVKEAPTYVLVKYVGKHECQKVPVEGQSYCWKCPVCGRTGGHEWEIVSYEYENPLFHKVKKVCKVCGKEEIKEDYHTISETRYVETDTEIKEIKTCKVCKHEIVLTYPKVEAHVTIEDIEELETLSREITRLSNERTALSLRLSSYKELITPILEGEIVIPTSHSRNIVIRLTPDRNEIASVIEQIIHTEVHPLTSRPSPSRKDWETITEVYEYPLEKFDLNELKRKSKSLRFFLLFKGKVDVDKIKQKIANMESEIETLEKERKRLEEMRNSKKAYKFFDSIVGSFHPQFGVEYVGRNKSAWMKKAKEILEGRDE